VAFSPNASNPAKDTLATFTQSGDYTFMAVIYDAQGLAATNGQVELPVPQRQSVAG